MLGRNGGQAVLSLPSICWPVQSEASATSNSDTFHTLVPQSRSGTKNDGGGSGNLPICSWPASLQLCRPSPSVVWERRVATAEPICHHQPTHISTHAFIHALNEMPAHRQQHCGGRGLLLSLYICM